VSWPSPLAAASREADARVLLMAQRRAPHPFVEAVAPHNRAGYLRDLRGLIAQAAQKFPGHADFVARHCQAARPGG
jgi:hypothetical protein